MTLTEINMWLFLGSKAIEIIDEQIRLGNLTDEQREELKKQRKDLVNKWNSLG